MTSNDLSRLCIHTMTNKPWSLDQCLSNYERVGITGISVWRNVIENQDLSAVKRRVSDAGISIVSLVRGGFFTGVDQPSRDKAIEENKLILEEAAEIGAPLVVLVCGATPGVSILDNINHIKDGIEALVETAEKLNVKLGIEPLHPMYADTRSAISSMESANDVAESIGSSMVGVTIDVFHLWWEKKLENQIKRCAENNNLFSYHICDWKTDMEDMLNDRGLMGDGIINVDQISKWVDDTGFKGYQEVEIFSKKYWEMDQGEFLDLIISRYKQLKIK
ncbi:MAG: xylose isomerase [Planctomycetota bacterium]|nr:MAG: xylose isomerase [Planctomycetota bacterium]